MINLASDRLGAESNCMYRWFFAEKENLIKPDAVYLSLINIQTVEMDGRLGIAAETCRRAWLVHCSVRLPPASYGFDIDTEFLSWQSSSLRFCGSMYSSCRNWSDIIWCDVERNFTQITIESRKSEFLRMYKMQHCSQCEASYLSRWRSRPTESIWRSSERLERCKSLWRYRSRFRIEWHKAILCNDMFFLTWIISCARKRNQYGWWMGNEKKQNTQQPRLGNYPPCSSRENHQNACRYMSFQR